MRALPAPSGKISSYIFSTMRPQSKKAGNQAKNCPKIAVQMLIHLYRLTLRLPVSVICRLMVESSTHGYSTRQFELTKFSLGEIKYGKTPFYVRVRIRRASWQNRWPNLWRRTGRNPRAGSESTRCLRNLRQNRYGFSWRWDHHQRMGWYRRDHP